MHQTKYLYLFSEIAEGFPGLQCQHSLLWPGAASQELVPVGLSLPQFHIQTLLSKTNSCHQISCESRKQKEKIGSAAREGLSVIPHQHLKPSQHSLYSLLRENTSIGT